MYDSQPDTVLPDKVFDLSQVGTCVQGMEEDHKDIDGVRIVIDKTEIKTEVEVSLSKFWATLTEFIIFIETRKICYQESIHELPSTWWKTAGDQD